MSSQKRNSSSVSEPVSLTEKKTFTYVFVLLNMVTRVVYLLWCQELYSGLVVWEIYVRKGSGRVDRQRYKMARKT